MSRAVPLLVRGDKREVVAAKVVSSFSGLSASTSPPVSFAKCSMTQG